MKEEHCTPAMRTAGTTLLAELDRYGVPVCVAMWVRLGEWTLILAGPEAESGLSLYRRVQMVIFRAGLEGPFPPGRVLVMNPSSPFFRGMAEENGWSGPEREIYRLEIGGLVEAIATAPAASAGAAPALACEDESRSPKP